MFRNIPIGQYRIGNYWYVVTANNIQKIGVSDGTTVIIAGLGYNAKIAELAALDVRTLARIVGK